MNVTLNSVMGALACVGGSVDCIGHNLSIVRFDVTQVALERYVMLDTLRGEVVATAETRSKLLDEVWTTS